MTWRGSSVIASSLTLAFPNPTPIAGKAEGSVLYVVPGKTSRHTDRHDGETLSVDIRKCTTQMPAGHVQKNLPPLGMSELSKRSKDLAKNQSQNSLPQGSGGSPRFSHPFFLRLERRERSQPLVRRLGDLCDSRLSLVRK